MIAPEATPAPLDALGVAALELEVTCDEIVVVATSAVLEFALGDKGPSHPVVLTDATTTKKNDPPRTQLS